RQKRLPCKFLYDERGSWLFERICDLEEYYPTRTELGIMRRWGGEMAALLGRRCILLEYGSGSSVKTRILLDHLEQPEAYVPIDISRQQLMAAASAMTAAYPNLQVLPVCADYTQDFSVPIPRGPATRTIVYFPGSTIGNFEPSEARDFLRRIRQVCGPRGALLIGVDLKKDPRLLHAAYNDPAGVTTAFNLNLLARINRELAADFALHRFSHYAYYNPRRGRIEMHLLSLGTQTVHVAGERFEFADGESIFTESSYKYSPREFEQLASESGYRLQRIWVDARQLFSVQYLTAQ
ncbi:MAG TPA: L-histidine N(alpha)-methyltransferase, partial [Tepidisphaeraceae bacterium]|nr:L-histidine N(alpha)-methyltransferase [Tepidisphaeraceae bacterium]